MQSGSKRVLSVTSAGLTVEGIIKATGGEIGSFTVYGDALRYRDGENGGIYIGSGGIIGSAGPPVGGVNQWKFALSPDTGDLTCSRITITDDNGMRTSSIFQQFSPAVLNAVSVANTSSDLYSGVSAVGYLTANVVAANGGLYANGTFYVTLGGVRYYMTRDSNGFAKLNRAL